MNARLGFYEVVLLAGLTLFVRLFNRIFQENTRQEVKNQIATPKTWLQVIASINTIPQACDLHNRRVSTN